MKVLWVFKGMDSHCLTTSTVDFLKQPQLSFLLFNLDLLIFYPHQATFSPIYLLIVWIFNIYIGKRSRTRF